MLKTFGCYTHYLTLHVQKRTYKNIAPDLAQVKRTESGSLDHGTKGTMVFNTFHSKFQARRAVRLPLVALTKKRSLKNIEILIPKIILFSSLIFYHSPLIILQTLP